MGSELFVKPLEPLPKHYVFGLSGTYTARASSRKSLSLFFLTCPLSCFLPYLIPTTYPLVCACFARPYVYLAYPTNQPTYLPTYLHTRLFLPTDVDENEG